MVEVTLSPIAAYGTQTRPKKKQAFFPSLLSLLPPILVAAVRVSPCHSRQPSVISDASALEGDRSSTPSDINSPRHRTHSLCNVRAAHHCTLSSAAAPPQHPSVLAVSRICLSLSCSHSATVERVHPSITSCLRCPALSPRPFTQLSISLFPSPHSP